MIIPSCKETSVTRSGTKRQTPSDIGLFDAFESDLGVKNPHRVHDLMDTSAVRSYKISPFARLSSIRRVRANISAISAWIISPFFLATYLFNNR